MGAGDAYTLRNGQYGSSDWDKVGSKKEGRVKMADYMTYDELKLASMIQLSSPVIPINT